MPRALLLTILGCGLIPLNALAVWEYSAADQLAMYDAVEHRCGSLDPDTFRRKFAEMVKGFTAEERAQMTQLRESAQYRESLSASSKELAQQIAAAGKDGAAIVCKKIIGSL